MKERCAPSLNNMSLSAMVVYEDTSKIAIFSKHTLVWNAISGAEAIVV